jgi:hypothetical protein
LGLQKLIEESILGAFRMDEATWERHANPWSVWTRFSAMPLLVLAAWSRVWLRRWALAPIALAVLWTWLNPRVFGRPRSTDNWASKSVLGERVVTSADAASIPARHRLMPNLLNGVSGVGSLFVIAGVAKLRVWPTLLGMALVYLGKVWYLDRMVWLYEDVKDAKPEYRSWLY